MLDGYDEVWRMLGDKKAPEEAANRMIEILNKKYK
jgi:hypothetical protein